MTDLARRDNVYVKLGALPAKFGGENKVRSLPPSSDDVAAHGDRGSSRASNTSARTAACSNRTFRYTKTGCRIRCCGTRSNASLRTHRPRKKQTCLQTPRRAPTGWHQVHEGKARYEGNDMSASTLYLVLAVFGFGVCAQHQSESATTRPLRGAVLAVRVVDRRTCAACHCGARTDRCRVHCRRRARQGHGRHGAAAFHRECRAASSARICAASAAVRK